MVDNGARVWLNEDMTTQTTTTDREVAMSASLVLCPCGCGEAVTLTLPGGFAGVTCEVGACTSQRNAGLVSATIRRSAGLSLRSVDDFGWRHADGLVTFGGSL